MWLQGAGGYWHWDVPWTAREVAAFDLGDLP